MGAINRRRLEGTTEQESYVKIPETLLFVSEGQSSISIKNVGTQSHNITYSLDGAKWSSLTNIPVSFKTIYLKGTKRIGSSYSQYSYFVITGDFVHCKDGNLYYLCKGNTNYSYNFYYLFKDCDKLVTAPEIPMSYSNSYMFCGCFSNCSNLKYVPNITISRSTLTNYYSLFANCTNLEDASFLTINLDNTLPDPQYLYGNAMFSGCSSLRTPPRLLSNIKVQKSACNYMFAGCTSLEEINWDKTLQAVFDDGFRYMFSGCTNLKKVDFAVLSSQSSGTTNSPFQYFFKNCSNLEKAPDIYIYYEAGNYSEMFSGCSKLSEIRCWGNVQMSSGTTNNWLKGTASQGVIKANREQTTTGFKPSGWEIKLFPIMTAATSYPRYCLGTNSWNFGKCYYDLEINNRYPQGIIVYRDEEKIKIMSTNNVSSNVWGPTGIYTGVTDDEDGKNNTQALLSLGESYVAALSSYNKTSKFYPVGSWYLPSKKDWEDINWAANIESLNEVLAQGISTPLSSSTYYWTSTEDDENNAFAIKNGVISSISKDMTNVAVRPFMTIYIKDVIG